MLAFPRRLIVGGGCVCELGGLLRSMGANKPLIITDREQLEAQHALPSINSPSPMGSVHILRGASLSQLHLFVHLRLTT